MKAAALPLAIQVLLKAAEARGEDGASKYREVFFYDKLDDKYIRCGICPNACTLGDGGRGICRSRVNHGGVHCNHAFGNPCILRPDPIEKLPMNNFLPGTDTVCVAVGGCNLRCLYCQNYSWSQKRPEEIEDTFDLSPGRAVHSVLKKDIRTIAFTYTDPVAFLEYACDITDIARKSGVRCIAATNGFVTTQTARRIADKMDAVTVGLKGFDEEFYRTVCGASLKPVLEGIEEIKSHGGCWMELTTLIVPTYNDDMKTIKAMARWIKKTVGTKVPWHLSRFVPRYRLTNVPRTPVQTLDDAMKIALDAGLEYVYTSNIAPHKGNNTYCPRCGRTLVERVGFKILNNALKGGRCKCGCRIPGFFPTDGEL